MIAIADLPERLRWQTFGASGWQFLLPAPPHARLICYDTLDGAGMGVAATIADEVLVVHHDRERLARLEATAAAAQLRNFRFALTSDAGARPGGTFDGALVHDPAAGVLRRGHGDAPGLGPLCSALAPALRPDGFLYLGLRSRFGYTRLRGGSAGEPRLASVASAARALHAAGLRAQARYPFLTEGGRLVELVPPGGYRSAKNPFLRAERLRELVLRGWGARHLAPAYGLLGFRGAARQSWLEHVLADPWLQSLAPGAAVRRCLVLNNAKLVLSLGQPGDAHGSLVLVTTPDRRAAEKRRAEARWLVRLAELPGGFASAVPRFHGERQLAGLTVFALAELPGITVDAETPLLPRLTTAAAEWLAGFHRATARPTEMTADAVRRLLGYAFEPARERYPPFAADLGAIEDAVAARLAGRTLPLVFMHGDYKLENVMFDEASCALRAVIDWELAQEPGPPLLDLLYLLAYNRVVRHEAGSLASVEALATQEWTAEETRRIDCYHEALEGCRAVQQALCALFAVHHVGLRVRYDLAHEGVPQKMRSLFSAVRAALAAPAA